MSNVNPIQLDKKKIGQRIKDQRSYLNIDRNQFADSIPIAHSHLVKIENGNSGMSLEVLCAISEKLNLSIDYILKGDAKLDGDEGNNIIIENIMRSIRSCNTPQLKNIEKLTQAAVSLIDTK